MSISVIIPTRDAGRALATSLKALRRQTLEDLEILVVDSSSSDDTAAVAEAHGAKVLVIAREQFDHGGTRTLAAREARGRFLVYMTQDAVLADDRALERLVRPLVDDEKVAAVFGRQSPHAGASLYASHLRGFNYPETSYVRTLADRRAFGLKTAFCSNAFAAYRRDALSRIGWFKERLLMGEDMHACGRLLLEGYKLAYASDARAIHSHNYSWREEFQRYFDTGIFHRQERWLLKEFGRAEGEGIRYVSSEISFLMAKRAPHLVPSALIRSSLKYAGYRLGYSFASLPRGVVARLSRQPNWDRRWRHA